jgi:Flp pilus assembly protein CpaB
VDVTDTPAALIAPGDFVDVLASGPMRALRLAPQLTAAGAQNSNQDNQVTVTLLQNVQVLAVQREYVENGGPYDPAVRGAPPQKRETVSHVTLALTPEQVQLLWQASTQKGKITLALRSFGDGETKPLAAITDPRAQGLSFQIPDGLRAFTIPVSVTNTPAALIAPGDFVDVLVSGSMQTLRLARHLANAWGENANEDRKVTATLFQNVRVLTVQREFLETGVPYDPAVGAALPQKESGVPSDPAVRGPLPQKETVNYVSLALTPEQGQLLLVVSNEGKITLALRPFGDAQLVAVEPITEPRAELLSYQVPQGWRGFTFPVDVTTSPVALVAPGDFVDVLVTVDIFKVLPNGTEKKVATKVETLLQNMRVLAVRREYLNKAVPQDASVRGAPVKEEEVIYLTLALTPTDAQHLAAYPGPAIRVTLRQVGDEQLPVLDPVTVEIASLP